MLVLISFNPFQNPTSSKILVLDKFFKSNYPPNKMEYLAIICGVLICLAITSPLTSGAAIKDTTLPSTVIKRSTNNNLSPCFLVGAEAPVTPADYPTALKNLNTLVDGLRVSTNDIIQYFEQGDAVNKPVITAGPVLGYLRTQTFISDIDSVTVTDQNKKQAVKDTVTALLQHAELLNHVISHLQASRTTGILATEDLGDKIREKILGLENHYYSVMCQTKIVLRSLGTDLPTLEPAPLADLFLEIGSLQSYTNDLYRAYIVFNDSVKTSTYLLHIYDAVKLAL